MFESGVGVLERVRGVRVVEAAAVRAELLDDLLRGDGAAGDGLRLARQRGDLGAGGEVLDRAQSRPGRASPTTAIGSRMRRQPRTRSTQKLPSRSVRDRVKPRIRATATAIPTAAETKFCTARPGHLGQVAHRGLAGVGLPVGVGHERGGRVERLVRAGRRGIPGSAAGGAGAAAGAYRQSTDTAEKASRARA